METINYQGQEVLATKVNYLSGTIPTSTVDVEGDEELFRDSQGRYYLRRQLNLLADYHEDHGEGNISASGRTHVHRINVNAAILWATTRLNSETLDLRCDAANLLMEGRGYSDPHPAHLSAGQRDSIRSAAVQGAIAPSAAYGVSPSTLEAATRHAATAGRTLDEMVSEFLEAMAENASESGEASKQLAVTPKSPVGVRVAPAGQRFTFDYPATRKTCGLRRTVEVSDEQMKRVRELAAIFELTPKRFLKGLANYNDLPGQPRRSDNKLRGLLQDENISFACSDEAMAQRIKRAAQARCQTVDEFIADSLGGDVDMWEEAMLLHPTTGELLEADFEELFTETSCNMVVAPVGREDEPGFKRRPAGTQFVRFSVYLTPEQLERVEYPNIIYDAETGRDVPVVIIPVNSDGNPYLEIGGRKVEPSEELEVV